MLKSRSPIAALEADLSALVKRGASLETRRDVATAAALKAVGARRVMLTDLDDPDPMALEMADRAVREAEGAKDGALDALREIDSRIDDVRDRLARLQAAEECERQASAIEASAKAADAAIDRIRKAASDIDRARADLTAAILPEAVGCYMPPSRPPADYMPSYLTTARYFDFRGEAAIDTIGPEQVAARIVGHVVSTIMPTLGVARVEDAAKPNAGGQPTAILAPIVDADGLRAILTDPMRAAAARAREGLAQFMPSVAGKEPRRRADRWTTDKDGRSFDSSGVRVSPAGFYVDDASEAA